MSEFRTIETASYAKIEAPSSLGRPPKLEWLSIKQLVIDPEYQREITLVGRKNIRRIVEQFNWSMFAPIMVAGVGANRYAIVDGQHRATAAALAGVDKVPCAIIEALRGEQAAAFRAINANTTKLHTVQLFHASVAAKEPDALKVLAVCKQAGIVIPRSLGVCRARETFCVTTIRKGIERAGDKTTVLALRAIIHSGDGSPIELNQTIIGGTINVLHSHPDWCKSESALFLAFEAFNLEDMWRAAASAAAMTRGTSTPLQFEASLIEALAAQFGKRKRA